MQERNGEPDFSKKHPLEYKWTLWFDNPKGTQNQNNWGQTLRAVYTFDTVEDFWWYGLTHCVFPCQAKGLTKARFKILVFPTPICQSLYSYLKIAYACTIACSCLQLVQ